MPRTRRTWKSLRDEARRLLREPEPTGPPGVDEDTGWDNQDLLDFANQSIDFRGMEMMEAHEGWMTNVFATPLVGNQREYQLPEGISRIKRIVLRFNEGGRSFEIPLIRAERWSEPMFEDNSVAAGGSVGTIPTYRMMGDKIFLEPPPTTGANTQLLIEAEGLPPRLIGNDNDLLPQVFPDIYETLFIYDIVATALAQEDSQGNLQEGYVNHLGQIRRRYEKAWADTIAVRTHGRVFSSPYYLGD